MKSNKLQNVLLPFSIGKNLKEGVKGFVFSLVFVQIFQKTKKLKPGILFKVSLQRYS